MPASWEALERGAAATCPGLSWSVLAAIGEVDSDSGRSVLPGVRSGVDPAGTEGPMDLRPGVFAAWAVVGPGGTRPPSPYDPVDAVYTDAGLLCARGAGSPGGLYRAVWGVDHSVPVASTVLVLARALAADPGLGSVPAAAVAFAASELGSPYRWGGTGRGGYDCSGLVQAAYRVAGVRLPRVAQSQFDTGPAVPPTTAPLPGDLVFFGSAPGDVTHVGIYVGDGLMVDAPHDGAVVRAEDLPTVPGRRWGKDRYLGATRPAGG